MALGAVISLRILRCLRLDQNASSPACTGRLGKQSGRLKIPCRLVGSSLGQLLTTGVSCSQLDGANHELGPEADLGPI